MKKVVYINQKIKNFNKKITIPGDKSLSIRFILLASKAIGMRQQHIILLNSEDVNKCTLSNKKIRNRLQN